MDAFGSARVRLGCAVHLSGMTTQLRTVAGLDPLLSIEDLAEYLGVPIATIYDWRVDGKGPRGIRVGRHVKFTTGDVLAWIETQREVRPDQHRR
ncbi:helix-turn-helix domain-containing protein [Nocardioides sp. YIM 152315]|nr:helix-turn-helix domain-containing protein [Nocardioides sp. YIM 152315]